jgi:hypothetical protein
MVRDVHPGSGFFFSSQIPDPGVKKSAKKHQLPDLEHLIFKYKYVFDTHNLQAFKIVITKSDLSVLKV